MSPTRLRLSLVALTAFTLAPPLHAADPLPVWRQAGLSDAEAAAHLLDRFAFGPRPGEVEQVVALGLEAWLDRQLAVPPETPELERRLARLDGLDLAPHEMVSTYLGPGRILQRAAEAGALPEGLDPRGAAPEPSPELRRAVRRFAEREGLRAQGELLDSLASHKLMLAVSSEAQLREVLSEFWYNHFNVPRTHDRARAVLAAYERDALRPHLLGPFSTLLQATARHPAMLLYLDNVASVAAPGVRTTIPGGPRPGGGNRPGRRRPDGPNENYARELMELHTLGVDGGYTQTDVVEVARALTGWAVVPLDAERAAAEAKIERALRRFDAFVREDEFLFRADAHDAEPKRVLGRKLPAGRGIEDGDEVLAMLASHPSTARHVGRKLAVRFVADDPPTVVVDRLALTFERTGGSTAALVRTLFDSPEFWAARDTKLKSPFELAASTLRAVGATVDSALPTLDWIERMGQPMYGYSAPTGYPDRAEFWLNASTLEQRWEFAEEVARGTLAGVRMAESRAPGTEPDSWIRSLVDPSFQLR